MSAAAWGLIGIFVGSLITIAGNLLMHRFESSERAERARAEAEARAREERKLAYMRLLTTARRLRYLARPKVVRDPEEIETLRTELSSVRYEIALIAPEVADDANAVRRATLDYLNAARATRAENGEPVEQSPELRKLRLSARSSVRDFIEVAFQDLGGDRRTTTGKQDVRSTQTRMSKVERDPERGRAAAAKLKALGVKGILITAAEQGYITQVACKMPECFCPEELGGACYFEPDQRSDWSPTHEHFPLPKKDGGHRTVDNAILAHRLCNRIDHSIRAGSGIARDLERVRKAREEAIGRNGPHRDAKRAGPYGAAVLDDAKTAPRVGEARKASWRDLPASEMAAHLLATPTITDRAWTEESRLPGESREAFIRRVLLSDVAEPETPE